VLINLNVLLEFLIASEIKPVETKYIVKKEKPFECDNASQRGGIESI